MDQIIELPVWVGILVRGGGEPVDKAYRRLPLPPLARAVGGGWWTTKSLQWIAGADWGHAVAYGLYLDSQAGEPFRTIPLMASKIVVRWDTVSTMPGFLELSDDIVNEFGKG